MRNDFKHAGFVLDLEEAASRLPPETGKDYVAFNHWALSDLHLKSAIKKPYLDNRAAIALPVEIGSFHLGDSQPVSHNTMVIKPSNSYKIYIPGDEEYTVSVADIVAADLLRLYGAEAFKNCQMLYACRHTIVQPNKVQIETADKFHPHTDGRHPNDLFYLFQTALPTEILVNGKIVRPRAGTITRLGGEVMHRSAINDGPEMLRTFGAIFIERKESYAPRPIPLAVNTALENCDASLLPYFKSSAQGVLSRPQRSLAFDHPIPVLDNQAHTYS